MLASRRDNLMLWPWGVSRIRDFPQIPVGLHLVTALSFLSGMTRMLGGEVTVPPGATGYLNSDLNAKFAALTHRLADFEVNLIHCNAPDEESHIYNLQGKVQAIEDIDRQVVSPLLRYMQDSREPYRILLCPDHYTCCSDGKHRSNLVPYAVTGSAITPNHRLTTYSEADITQHIQTVTLESYQLITTFLKKQ